MTGVGTHCGPLLRPVLGQQFVQALAAIHTVPAARLSELTLFERAVVGSNASIVRQIHWWRRVWEEDRPEDLPLVNVAARWLIEHAPPRDHVSVVHGDFRAGNFLFAENSQRITAWLDWELAVLGDRHQDLTWASLRDRARQAAAAIHKLIDQRLTDLANGAAPGDHVVSAMAGGQALNELLLRPSVLVMARDAACRGDRELVLQYVMEALRFNPMFHFIPRTCVRDTALHVAGAPPVEIKAGQQLFVGAGFPEPEHFRTDRPLAS